MKHQNLDTTYVKFYCSDNPHEKFFQLGESVALELANEMLVHLSNIAHIDEIVDIAKIYSSLSIPIPLNLDIDLQNNNQNLGISDNSKPIQKLLKK